jgi:hypothetical protein
MACGDGLKSRSPRARAKFDPIEPDLTRLLVLMNQGLKKYRVKSGPVFTANALFSEKSGQGRLASRCGIRCMSLIPLKLKA